MGLDVYLCRFKDVSTGAILKLSHFVDVWNAMPVVERGSFEEVTRKAVELGLPETAARQSLYGGTHISFPSKKHPEWSVGDWYSLGGVFELLERYTQKNIYFVFPEAKGNPSFFRPDWSASRKRLAGILEELQTLNQEQIENYRRQLVMSNIPPSLLQKVKPTMLVSASEIFANKLGQIEVMIETLDYVLNNERPDEFLLRWSS